MTDPTTRLALTTLIASAISHCEHEIAEMNRAVRLLEKDDRRRIEATWQDGQQWRGLASDDFTRMVEALVILTDGALTFRDG
ncbi:hypothetical protein [Paracoccus chinensis]|uniref:Uncharacterized protein n=1 Tax=Paracoccus chinensis TaxID=525640 RepID=A0A1G9P9Y0_9RHOB|nr:hypothetical protein [Paracoccus chinensis]SDL95588.1 hypothetical protein SAMN04487971_1512 [Paracoccus chinensis]